MKTTLTICRDGNVVQSQHLGFIVEVTVDGFVRARYFHNALPYTEQKMGHGYMTKRAAAEALAKVKSQ